MQTDGTEYRTSDTGIIYKNGVMFGKLVDEDFSEESENSIMNKTVTAKFTEMQEYVDGDLTDKLKQYADEKIDDEGEVSEDKTWSNNKINTKFEEVAQSITDSNEAMTEYVDTALEDYTKSATEILQADYDALDEETKLANNYHCTDSGRLYYKGILYGGKQEIELTLEQYKELEENNLVEEDVSYVIISNQSGVLLGSEDISYKDKTVHEALVTLEENITELANKEDTYTTTDVANVLFNACYTLGVDCRNQYVILNVTATDDSGNSVYFNSIYKHTTKHYVNVISENGLTISGINNTGTVAFSSSAATVKVKYIGICDDTVASGLTDGSVSRANKNALSSDITATYLIKDIAAGGENEKTVSFKIYKGYFSTYYAKRTFLLSANIYSLGFSKPVIGLIEIYRSSTDGYSGYVVNLQDTRYTGVTVTVNGDYLEVDVTFNSYDSSGCMVSCSSLSNIPIA